jgi:hypothetical protein
MVMMDIISELVLKQYIEVDNCGIVSMNDMVAVRNYAMKHDLMYLAGWLSWNGEKYYQYLVRARTDGLNQNFVNAEIKPTPPVRKKVVVPNKPQRLFPRAPKRYYVNRQEDGDE